MTDTQERRFWVDFARMAKGLDPLYSRKAFVDIVRVSHIFSFGSYSDGNTHIKPKPTVAPPKSPFSR